MTKTKTSKSAKPTRDDAQRAREQGQAQFEAIREMVAALHKARESGNEADIEAAEQAIHEDPLSIEVRSDWYRPGEKPGDPTEYLILLCTGGPAARIVGRLDDSNQPESAQIEVQDWFQPWSEFSPTGKNVTAVLLDYVGCFYFGG